MRLRRWSSRPGLSTLSACGLLAVGTAGGVGRELSSLLKLDVRLLKSSGGGGTDGSGGGSSSVLVDDPALWLLCGTATSTIQVQVQVQHAYLVRPPTIRPMTHNNKNL